MIKNDLRDNHFTQKNIYKHFLLIMRTALLLLFINVLCSVANNSDNLSGEISSLTIQQQKKQIRGNVTDENGDAIIGANIIERGTTNGTITDIDGNFTLSVAENAMIHISYIVSP